MTKRRNNPNAHTHETIDPFWVPVPTPSPGVFDDPLLCLEINDTWARYLTGLIERMRFTDMWTGTDAEVDTTIQEVEKLLDAFNGLGNCSVDQCDGDCLEILSRHPAVTYWPNHPTLQPGIIFPPFADVVWEQGVNGGGIQASDSLINTEGILANFSTLQELLDNGVPSWTLEFDGIGEITVEFVTQVQGGACWIFPDGNPLVGDYVDLNYRSLSEFDSTNVLLQFLEILQGDPNIFTTTHTIDFTTPGAHTLTCWYIPVGDAEPPWIGFGGGLRGFKLCGDVTVDGTIEMPYSLSLNGCTLELEQDGQVVDTVDLSSCNLPQYPVKALRDDGCQLQYQDVDDLWQNVDGARYYTVEADCVLENRIRLNVPSTEGNVLLGKRTTDPTNRIALGFDYLLGLVGNFTVGRSGGMRTNWGSVDTTFQSSSGSIVARLDDDGRLENELTHVIRNTTDTGAGFEAGEIAAHMADSTHATRQGGLTLYGRDWSGQREAIRVEGNGSQAEIGVFGQDPEVQQYAPFDEADFNAIPTWGQSLYNILDRFGWINLDVIPTCNIDPPPDPGQWAIQYGDGNAALVNDWTIGYGSANGNTIDSDLDVSDNTERISVALASNWSAGSVATKIIIEINVIAVGNATNELLLSVQHQSASAGNENLSQQFLNVTVGQVITHTFTLADLGSDTRNFAVDTEDDRFVSDNVEHQIKSIKVYGTGTTPNTTGETC